MHDSTILAKPYSRHIGIIGISVNYSKTGDAHGGFNRRSLAHKK